MRKWHKGIIVVLACALITGAGCARITLIGADAQTQSLAARADAGDTEAGYQLGLRYTSGTGVRQNFAYGMQYFRQAAGSGHVAAQYLYGMGFYTGRGTGRDLKQARLWLQRAADQGYASACHQLGQIYINGQGVPAEPGWGMHWVAQAAEQGNPSAQLLFGVGYLKGIGIDKNRLQGMKWLALAESSGSSTATEMLKRLAHRQPDAVAIARQASARWRKVLAGKSRSRQRIRYIQYRLAAEGFDTGAADGVWGPKTEAAATGFSRRFGKTGALGRELLITRLRERERGQQRHP